MKSSSQFSLCFSFLPLILLFCRAVNSDYGVCGSIVQLSRCCKTSDVRMLKANLLSSREHDQHHHDAKRKPHMLINAWLDPKDQYEIYLLVDEVYDANKRRSLLTNPYLIQLSTTEQTLTYPLMLNDVVNVACNDDELVHRREAVNNRTLIGEHSQIKMCRTKHF